MDNLDWKTGCFFLLILLLAVQGCRKVEVACEQSGLAPELGQAPDGFPPIPFPEGNEFTMERWELGKRLFYDPVLSADSSLSCGSCHHVELAFADDRPFSPGIEDRPGTRNAPALVNLAYHPYFLREGSVPTLEMQILVPIQEENEFDHNIVLVAEKLQRDSSYVAQAWAAYGREPDAFVITRAISTFERTLVSGGSPYDDWLYRGCEDALDDSQQRGMALFFSTRTNCSSCHSGLNFTTYTFENNGLYSDYTDPGRFRFTNDPADEAKFKVPGLRNVAVTAPYMHDGSMASLEAVVAHYNGGGAGHVNQSELVQPLGLSDQEMQDLVHFLEALTDPSFISNPQFAE